MGSIFAAMRRCQLFDGIPEEKYQNVLNCLHGEVRAIPKDTILLRIGDCQKRPGVVMSGTLRISLYSEDGNLLTIDRLSRGRVFGETLVCSMSGNRQFVAGNGKRSFSPQPENAYFGTEPASQSD